MSKSRSDSLRYPVGRCTPRRGLAPAEISLLIDDLAGLPADFRAAATGLPPHALDRQYRPGGWTARQVVHHVPDSHMNAYVRFKLALTEDDPAIRPYDEAAWADLPDGSGGDIEISLMLLDALHLRWTTLLRALGSHEFRRAYHHPESGRTTLEHALQLYVWHGRHHLAHVRLVAG
jgi:hypothetical protein